MSVTFAPDPEPRNSAYHKKIVSALPMEGTMSGHRCELECGHRILIFGGLELAHGVAFCCECWEARDKSPRSGM